MELSHTIERSPSRATRRSVRRLSRRVGLWAVAFLFLVVAACSTAPSSLSGLYEQREHLSSLAQFEVGMGLVPGGGAMARLSRLVGRGRALEILLAADDLDGPRAERYGYVNRAIADNELDDAVDEIASRLARFDHDAIARTKSYVDQVTLPADSELVPALADFGELLARPAQQARLARLEALGLNLDGDLERYLGRRVVEANS